VDTADIEIFLTLAEELHFGRTAERLHLTQPRVTRVIAALEGHAGGKLFERTSRKVRLTPLGARLRARRTCSGNNSRGIAIGLMNAAVCCRWLGPITAVLGEPATTRSKLTS
jgi:DNA-binding MarR family transcriptional regulator